MNGSIRQGGNARRERWFGAASEFVFDLLGIRDGIDMHEYFETAEVPRQIEVNEIMNVGEQEQRGVEVIRYGAKGGMVSSSTGKTTRS